MLQFLSPTHFDATYPAQIAYFCSTHSWLQYPNPCPCLIHTSMLAGEIYSLGLSLALWPYSFASAPIILLHFTISLLPLPLSFNKTLCRYLNFLLHSLKLSPDTFSFPSSILSIKDDLTLLLLALNPARYFKVTHFYFLSKTITLIFPIFTFSFLLRQTIELIHSLLWSSLALY